ncbi:MAG: CDP-alcohol phosphatidyltransferase family protein [Bacteroidales bacterium]|nr:CDP-alcohol phosphatidyltransferase family protein [Bacteroidales bacterium]
MDQNEVKERVQSARIQTSVLNSLEKKMLVWMAERMPRWISSDMLTGVGILGAVIVAVGYFLSSINLNWLWLASFGFVVNWFGDSLDGTLARVRNTQRPLYGFYLDHNIDGINESLMIIGAGLSPLFDLRIALLALAAYLLLSMYVYINAHLKNEFRLTYAGLGPTEFRIIVIIVNTVYLYAPALREWSGSMSILGRPFNFGVFDIVGLVIVAILVVIYIVSFIGSAREFSRLDPPKKF